MLRALLLGDTHLGFDLPARPRTERRRRGPDFQACYERATDVALATGVDVVIHGGDVFDRPDPRDALVDDAFRPLWRLAEAGVEVLVVAGNHERGALPRPLYAAHPRIHVIDAPETRTLTIRGMRVALGAFPYVRKVRGAFSAAVADTGLLKTPADVRLLVVHHAVEGVAVGAGDLRPDLDGRAPVRRDFVFTEGADVIRGRDVPAGVAAVLSGHIHRHQIIEHDLAGRPLAAPVVYAGSVERTSPAEAPEPKLCLGLTLAPGDGGGRLVQVDRHPLPARPLLRQALAGATLQARRDAAEAAIARAPADAVLHLEVDGLGAEWLRAVTPPTMTVEAAPPRAGSWARRAGGQRPESP
ncbi:MAG: metallophosphoesterase [Myxococcales bacterium]|nr:metallophosphoesterase [Myxococcales bacterium]